MISNLPGKKTNPKSRFLLALIICTLAACASTRVPTETDSRVEQMVSKINTATDPNFVYEFEQSKFVPLEGKTLLIMGQSVEAINEYLDSFPDQPTPGGWAA